MIREFVAVAHDCVAFPSNLLVGPEKLRCQYCGRFHTTLHTAFATNHSLCHDCYFDVVFELQAVFSYLISESALASQHLISASELRKVHTQQEDLGGLDILISLKDEQFEQRYSYHSHVPESSNPM